MGNKDLKTVSTVNISIFMLTLITAGAHLYLSAQPGEELHFWFLVNGLGYLVLLTLFFFPMLKSARHIIGWTLFGYILLTIALWLFLRSPREGKLDPFDVVVKAVEVTLAVELFLESRAGGSRELLLK